MRIEEMAVLRDGEWLPRRTLRFTDQLLGVERCAFTHLANFWA